MSDHYLSLKEIAKSRYRLKLQLLGISLENDPYISGNANFQDDITAWPPVEYGHIFGYFIRRPGVYTQEQLLSWKQLDSYNYFTNGYVRTVMVWDLKNSSSCKVLKAFINPSQNAPASGNTAWVAVKEDGEIVSAHCTCMAGLGEGCSHVAALLFKVEYAVRNGLTSVTSQLCSWNQTFCEKIDPAPIVDINFAKPKRKQDTPKSARSQLVPTPCPSESEKVDFLHELEKIMPHSGVLTAFAPRPSTSKETREVSKLPQRLTCLYDEKYKQLRPDELAAACMTIFESGLIVLPEEALFLEASTRLQHLSSVWHEHRVGRIIASKFHASSRAGTNPPPRSLLEQLMGYKPVNSSAIPALDWGIKNEKIARMQYLERASGQHEGLEYHLSGLHVNPQFPHLGASPDGLICCECCGEGTVEIKCPYKYRQCNSMDVLPTSLS